MLLVALMIQVAQGRTEAHFAVFRFLAVTTIYRHWLPVVVAAAVIALHHLSFNYWQSLSWGPICFTEPGWGRVLEHALFVVAQAMVMIFLAHRARNDFAAGEELSVIAHRLVADNGSVDFTVTHVNTESPTTRLLLEALWRVEQAPRCAPAAVPSPRRRARWPRAVWTCPTAPNRPPATCSRRLRRWRI